MPVRMRGTIQTMVVEAVNVSHPRLSPLEKALLSAFRKGHVSVYFDKDGQERFKITNKGEHALYRQLERINKKKASR